jgi:hypothetical protein
LRNFMESGITFRMPAPRNRHLRKPAHSRADPGASVVAALGGPTAVAARLGLSPTTPMRWGLPLDAVSRGTGGIIPPKHHHALRLLAAELGVRIDLTAPPARVANPRNLAVRS